MWCRTAVVEVTTWPRKTVITLVHQPTKSWVAAYSREYDQWLVSYNMYMLKAPFVCTAKCPLPNKSSVFCGTLHFTFCELTYSRCMLPHEHVASYILMKCAYGNLGHLQLDSPTLDAAISTGTGALVGIDTSSCSLATDLRRREEVLPEWK